MCLQASCTDWGLTASAETVAGGVLKDREIFYQTHVGARNILRVCLAFIALLLVVVPTAGVIRTGRQTIDVQVKIGHNDHVGPPATCPEWSDADITEALKTVATTNESRSDWSDDLHDCRASTYRPYVDFIA